MAIESIYCDLIRVCFSFWMEGRSERRTAAYDLRSKNRDNHERIMTSTARRRAKPARFGLYYYDYGKSFFVWKVTIPGEGPQLSDELEGQGIKNALAWAPGPTRNGAKSGEDWLTDWGSETHENQIRFLFVNHVNLEMWHDTGVTSASWTLSTWVSSRTLFK